MLHFITFCQNKLRVDLSKPFSIPASSSPRGSAGKPSERTSVLSRQRDINYKNITMSRLHKSFVNWTATPHKNRLSQSPLLNLKISYQPSVRNNEFYLNTSKFGCSAFCASRTIYRQGAFTRWLPHVSYSLSYSRDQCRLDLSYIHPIYPPSRQCGSVNVARRKILQLSFLEQRGIVDDLLHMGSYDAA